MAHPIKTVRPRSHFFPPFLRQARQLGYQGELEMIGFLVVLGLIAGAYALAAILLGYSLW